MRPSNRSLRVLVTFILLSIASRADADPNALWTIVHNKCVPDAEDHGKPAPCSLVSNTGRYTILKDLRGATQFMLIPTDKITGIEDPAILKPLAPNYFSLAWQNRDFVAKALGRDLPREDVALAINSAYGRTQNQLHIHIDCVRADVAEALKSHANEIGVFPTKALTLTFLGHHYRVGRIDGDTLVGANPFSLVASQGGNMAAQTIVVVGASFPDSRSGFYILNDQAKLASLDHASGEELEDHSCGILGKH